MFRTTYRRCEGTNLAPKHTPTCERIGELISIDQVVRALLAECALVALRDDLRYSEHLNYSGSSALKRRNRVEGVTNPTDARRRR
jgi:hypothetical protein